MPSLPYASTETCRICGADATRDRYRFSLVESVARDTIHTGNLCDRCYGEMVDIIESGSLESTRQ